MKIFFIALQFLTIFPLKINASGEALEISGKDLGRSLAYFPVVGILIGAILALVAWIFNFLPHLAVMALVLISSIFISGGIHLDGFSDTCDGLYAGKTKEQIIEIMHDPHIGAMGVISLVSLLLLKFTLLVSLPLDFLWQSLLIMAVSGRWSQVLSCYGSKYAQETGKAKFFIEYATLRELAIAAGATLLLFCLLAKWQGLLLFILVSLLAMLFNNYIKERISGVTGDTIGAASEISEAGALLIILILKRAFLL